MGGMIKEVRGAVSTIVEIAEVEGVELDEAEMGKLKCWRLE